MNWTTYSVLIAGVVGLGCSRHAPTAVKPVAKAQAETVQAAAPSQASAQESTDEKVEEPSNNIQVHGVNKKLVHPVSVFVDGVQVGVMTPGELPPGLELAANLREDDAEKRFYRLAEYFEKI